MHYPYHNSIRYFTIPIMWKGISSSHINPKVDSHPYSLNSLFNSLKHQKAEFPSSYQVNSMNFGVSKQLLLESHIRVILIFLGYYLVAFQSKITDLFSLFLFFLYDQLSWSGDKALKELQEANISLQSFPILQECAKKVLKLSVRLISWIF